MRKIRQRKSRWFALVRDFPGVTLCIAAIAAGLLAGFLLGGGSGLAFAGVVALVGVALLLAARN